MPQLHLTNDPQKPAYELTQGETLVIGRDDECDVTIDDPYLSRKHCQLIWDGNFTFLEDLESTGGVFVEGDKINNHVLQHGQVVTIGQTKLRYVLDPNPSQTLGGGLVTPTEVDQLTFAEVKLLAAKSLPAEGAEALSASIP